VTVPRVSAVLVDLDCGHLVDYVFPSLAAQSYRDLEIVVVDNGSRDGSPARIRRDWPATRIVPLGANTGFSRALNEGIRRTAGELVLSLNFDVVLEPDFVGALVAALDRHPEAGWAGGALRRLGPGGVADAIDCYGHWLLRSRYAYGCDPDRPAPAAYADETYVFGASACGALYRRRMLEDIAVDGEVFDEDLFAYFEDVDVDWRAQQRGWRCVFTPAARGAHMRGGTGLHQRPEYAALAPANRVLTMVKNDDLGAVLRDLGPIALRTARDAAMLARRPPALRLALARIIRLVPRMLDKRRRIRARRTVSPAYLNGLRLSSSFLG
jgi:GT2 family glycosyltransferase